MVYKMVVMDMDGTLLNDDKIITDKTKEVLNQAEKQGIKTVIATGRLFNFAANACDYMITDQPIITNNGAYIRMLKSEDVLYNHSLNLESLIKVLNILRKYNLTCACYSDHVIYADKGSFAGEMYEKINETLPSQYQVKIVYHNNLEEWKQSYQLDPQGFHKCIVIDKNTDLLYQARQELSEIDELNVTSSLVTNIEINMKNITKANAIKFIADKFNISLNEVICIGDGENDIDMIQVAGLGVAMGNAIDKVKKAADYITDTNQNDGVAKVIEKFCLNKKKHIKKI